MTKPTSTFERLAFRTLAAICFAFLVGVGYSFLGQQVPPWVLLVGLFVVVLGAPSLLGMALYQHRQGRLLGRSRTEATIAVGLSLISLLALAASFSRTL
jgi:hypothetical protein